MTVTPVPVSIPHAATAEEVAAALEVNVAHGLSSEEARARLDRFGPNQLAEPVRRGVLLRFLDQFRSVLILVLIGAAVLAGLVGEVKDTIVIAVVLVINASIGFFQEQRAEKSLEALRNMLSPSARIRRDGRTLVADAGDLVPGDVVLLEAGDRVPADARLVLASSVEVDESALTGESQPVPKRSDATAEQDAPLADREGMVHMNTALTRGRAEAVVTATGMQTSVGAIAEMLSSGEEPQTPLQRQLDTLGKRLAVLGLVAVTIYVALALARGEAPADIALRAVALAVATVPEGLPAVLALTLALGVHRMAKRNAIVKRLASVETLGSATVICSDKTGTLTLNEMTVREVLVGDLALTVHGQGYDTEGEVLDARGEPATLPPLLLDALALCSDAELTDDGEGDGIIGDPTEGALVVLAAKAGLDVTARRAEWPRSAEIPFDADYKYMVTYHDEGPASRLLVKGAADVLLRRCDAWLLGDDEIELTSSDRDRLDDAIATMGERGLRVLAVATRLVESPSSTEPHSDVSRLTLLGLLGIADPPRPEAMSAVALCHRAGVAVKMITGDHVATAVAIARELGIEGRAMTGAELAELTTDELAEVVDEVTVFARVAPEHKVAIVKALTARGHVVAMTGDGVNDAAALRSAHIGVAMGRTGTEVTKEAGDVILTDDNFATIVGAVEEGRSIYDNVVKFVRFQLSTNMGAISTFLGASVMGLPAPLTAVQILWVNIIMDGPPAMALGVDPARPGIMSEPPRRSGDQILSPARLVRLARVGLVMAIGTLAVLLLARDEWGDEVSLTMAFTTFVLFQLVNALNARAEHTTVFARHTFTNRWLWASLATVALLHIAAVHTPWGQAIFDTVALSAAQWLVCVGVALSVLVVEELVKLGTRLGARKPPEVARG
ncbi:cation-translocating P-type ATPase [Nocardioides ferulae]|uniref:cation-translocating P-type ATPase n=1 Tax=Nocardioides ferulae TaxID=2340821 RepID=UPI000EAF432F|nr:HAD-IC family P-type ATPase [Nocardioides ferulae]